MLPDPPLVLLGKARDDEHLALLVAGNATVSDEWAEGFISGRDGQRPVKSE